MKRLLTFAALLTALGVMAVAAAVVSAPAAADTGPSSYLCWNHDMTDPVAYLDTVADQMWATGKYIEPQAILGNVVGGTNIGAYHLVCNAPATLKMTDQALGGSGEVYGADLVAAYNKEHADTHNDLNVYHIWK